MEPGKESLEAYTLVWALSTLLPLCYLGYKKDDKKTKVCVVAQFSGYFAAIISASQHFPVRSYECSKKSKHLIVMETHVLCFSTELCIERH